MKTALTSFAVSTFIIAALLPGLQAAGEQPRCYGCADTGIKALMVDSDNVLNAGNAPQACTKRDKDDWNKVEADEGTEAYHCVKILADTDDEVGRGSMLNSDIEKKFGWKDMKAGECKTGMYDNNEALKGKLCICSQDLCNGATGVTMSISAMILAVGVAALRQMLA